MGANGPRRTGTQRALWVRGTHRGNRHTHRDTHTDTHKARRARREAAGREGRGQERETKAELAAAGHWPPPPRARGRGTKPSAWGSLGGGRGPSRPSPHSGRPFPAPGPLSARTHPPSSRAAPGPAGRAARRAGQAWCSGPSCPWPRQLRGLRSRRLKAASPPGHASGAGARDRGAGTRGPPRAVAPAPRPAQVAGGDDPGRAGPARGEGRGWSRCGGRSWARNSFSLFPFLPSPGRAWTPLGGPRDTGPGTVPHPGSRLSGDKPRTQELRPRPARRAKGRRGRRAQWSAALFFN